jgi:glucose/arabinose dehydrogenase
VRFVLLLTLVLLAACSTAAQQPLPPVNTPAPAPPTVAAPAPTAAPATAAPAVDPAPTAASAPPAVPAALPPAELAALDFSLEPVLEGFARPTHVTHAGDGSGRLFVTEQAGQIWIVRDGARTPFLDLTALVGARGNEQGLLSIAFHPNFTANNTFFVNYTDRDGTTVVARYTTDPADPDRGDPASAQVLLTIAQPAPNHNGGLLKFGPDGYLYIGTGDGGAAGDPWGNGQRLDTLLGKLLRIDVDGPAPYSVPADNPFVGRDDVRPEIWAWGLRNPWRFAFDQVTGDLYIADVGQNAYEEVHFEPANSPGGVNYGWNIMEGAVCFRANTCDQEGFDLPVAVYSHNQEPSGCSITGGYVYRGAAFPQLSGVYFYTDYCTGNLWALQQIDGAWQDMVVGRIGINASSFGEDEAGELYLADREGGGLYRLVVSE